MTDKIVFQKIKDGNYQVYHDMFIKLYSELCSFCSNIVNSDIIAEDIAQDVFTKLWEDRRKIEIQNSFRSYLFSMGRNQCITYMKRVNYQKSYIDYKLRLSYNLYDDNDTMELKDLENILDNCFNELPKRCKQVFEMSRVQAKKQEEISSALNISISTIKTQVGKALSYLRNCLKESYDVSEGVIGSFIR